MCGKVKTRNKSNHFRANKASQTEQYRNDSDLVEDDDVLKKEVDALKNMRNI